jgi:predicted DNA binding CopG/RHH family protein
MRKKLKPIPRFRTEAQERRFWEAHDSSAYVDWSKAERARFPNLKPSTTSISLRLPIALLERIKIAANKRDVPLGSCHPDRHSQGTAARRDNSPAHIYSRHTHADGPVGRHERRGA